MIALAGVWSPRVALLSVVVLAALGVATLIRWMITVNRDINDAHDRLDDLWKKLDSLEKEIES